MTAKEFLQQYRNADHDINAKLDQIHKLRELATKTTQALSERVQTSAENKTEKIVSKIVDMENEVDAEIDNLQAIKHKIMAVIKQVSDTKQRMVLERRYINGETWEQIADNLNYSYMQICRIHGRALQKAENVIECYTRPVV